MRPLKAPWRSAQFLDAEDPNGVCPPSELLSRINRIFGPRWHLWRDERQRFLLTEHDQRHIVRAILPSYPSKFHDCVLHFPRQTADHQQRQIRTKLEEAFGITGIRFIARRRVPKAPRAVPKEREPAVGINSPFHLARVVAPEDVVPGAIVQPYELNQLLAGQGSLRIMVAFMAEIPIYYIARHAPSPTAVGEIERFPLPRKDFTSTNEAFVRTRWFSPASDDERRKTERIISEALMLLIHNRGYDPRTNIKY